MAFPPEKAFHPEVSKVPILGPSSGNPKSFQDPKSVASIGNTIQAAADQAKADTLYDAPTKEGFRNEVYNPWILKTEACSKKEGFSKMYLNPSPYSRNSNNMAIVVLGVLGLLSICLSFSKKR
jgi:hypothetical protein